jgi:lipopolysaccharide export system protein LptA
MNAMNKWLSLTVRMLVALALLLSVAFAAEHKDRSNLPITIKSNEMAADNKGKTAIFTGKVVAKQGDVTIYSDRLTINYGDKKNDIEKIEADGNVRIVQENRIGTASHAVYESTLGRITLTGNPKIMQGTDTMSGNTITYFIDDDRSEVSSGPGRPVEVLIHPATPKGNAGAR